MFKVYLWYWFGMREIAVFDDLRLAVRFCEESGEELDRLYINEDSYFDI